MIFLPLSDERFVAQFAKHSASLKVKERIRAQGSPLPSCCSRKRISASLQLIPVRSNCNALLRSLKLLAAQVQGRYLKQRPSPLGRLPHPTVKTAAMASVLFTSSVFLLPAIVAAAPQPRSSQLSVSTNGGAFVGTSLLGVDKFLGIPFAQSP